MPATASCRDVKGGVCSLFSSCARILEYLINRGDFGAIQHILSTILTLTVKSEGSGPGSPSFYFIFICLFCTFSNLLLFLVLLFYYFVVQLLYLFLFIAVFVYDDAFSFLTVQHFVRLRSC